MSCRDVRGWLHREVDSLDETQRLVLEDHVAACDRCRADRDRLRLIRRIGVALPVPAAGARAYQRAIARALLQADAGAAARPGRARVPRSAAVLAVAAIAAIAIAVVLVRGSGSREPGRDPDAHATATAPPAMASPPAVGPPAGAPVPVDQPAGALPPLADDAPAAVDDPLIVLEHERPGQVPAEPPRAPRSAHERGLRRTADIVEVGALVDRATTLRTGAPVPADTPLRATDRARLRLASSRVVVAASSEIRWSPVARTLHLWRGAVEVDSDGTGVSRIVAERFSVELGDAAVAVEPGLVRVTRGAARVVDRTGSSGSAGSIDLTAGGAWRPGDTEPASAAPTASQTAARPTAASELIAQARARFAARDLAGAEQIAQRALAAAPPRDDQAEARILLADVAQASGALETAVARYTEVATAFADMSAAESALYAAARIELRRARVAAARALLERYLDRYPHGRYEDDVRRDLASLP